MASGGNRVKVGSFLGTASDKNIDTVGFKPKSVSVYNVDGDCYAYWNSEMADDSMIKTVDSGVGTTDISLVVTNGITPRANGFALGADADLNASAEKVVYEAVDGG